MKTNGKRLPRHRQNGNGAARDNRADAPVASGGSIGISSAEPMGMRESLRAALASFTLFPPPEEPPDISWRAQGEDIRRIFRQVNGIIGGVYRREVSRIDGQKQ